MDERRPTSGRRALLSFSVFALLYVGLSLLCLFYPKFVSWIPPSIVALGAAVLGPPAILVWGWTQRNIYFLATACVLIPLLAVWRTKFRGCGIAVAMLAWLFWGFIAWAVSI